MIAAAACLVAGCNDTAPTAPAPRAALPSVTIGGYLVPKFPSPSEQFNYAKSWFADPGEKRAALDAVALLYPVARMEKGHAALELAYTRLGGDYRMASRRRCLETIAEYNDILQEYEDLPEIRAKAHWYIGWIYCDLINETASGIESYRKVVEEYPDVRTVPAPPVPWVSIVYPADLEADRPATNTAPHYWAGIALVEIIRYSRDLDAVWDAFETLWKNYRAAPATGRALKLLLTRPVLGEKAKLFASEYLAGENVSPHLSKDIRMAMVKYGKSCKSGNDGKNGNTGNILNSRHSGNTDNFRNTGNTGNTGNAGNTGSTGEVKSGN